MVGTSQPNRSSLTENPKSKAMLLKISREERASWLETRILATAFRQSLKRGDFKGGTCVHTALCRLLADRALNEGRSLVFLINKEAQFQDSRLKGEGKVHIVIANEGAENSDQAQSLEQSSAELPPSDEPSAGPASYLDFGEDEDDEGPQIIFDEAEGILEGSSYHALERPPADHEATSIYGLIGAHPNDTVQFIHQCYLKAVRQLLRFQSQEDKSKVLNIHEFRRRLRGLAVAADLLCDSVTRADYDLRQLGLREPIVGQGLAIPEEAKVGGGKAAVSTTELLILSRAFHPDSILAIVEAQRTYDSHEFLRYLANSPYLNERESYALLLGSSLVMSGRLSIEQFNSAFQALRNTGDDFSGFLLARRWLSSEDIEALYSPELQELNPAVPKIVEVAVAPQGPVVQGAIAMTAQVPEWADNLLWGDDEPASAEPAPEPVIKPSDDEAQKPKNKITRTLKKRKKKD